MNASTDGAELAHRLRTNLAGKATVKLIPFEKRNPAESLKFNPAGDTDKSPIIRVALKGFRLDLTFEKGQWKIGRVNIDKTRPDSIYRPIVAAIELCGIDVTAVRFMIAM